VAAKSQAGIGAQAQLDIDSLFFYLVVIELLTAIFCVKKEKIPVLYLLISLI